MRQGIEAVYKWADDREENSLLVFLYFLLFLLNYILISGYPSNNPVP